MPNWDSMDDAYRDYVAFHPTYSNIFFTYDKSNMYCPLHPMFVMSQFIIDSLAHVGKCRYAITLPDDKCNILTLVIAKYFQFLQDDPEYADSIFENIVPGQHLKLGKAVAEFIDIDLSKNIIKYKVGKQTKLYGPITITTPISNYHLLLERTEADVSAEKKWSEAVIKVRDQSPEQGMSLYLDKFKQKRTGIKKTIVLFSQKNTAREELSMLKVNDRPIDSVLAYGELTEEESKPYVVQNKGKLDCLPGIAIANKLSQIINAIKVLGSDTFSAIYCTQDKFLEIADNLDAFKKILKGKIPVVLFVPETEFEKYDVFRDLGFVFWQWKPSTLKSNCFRVNDPVKLEHGIYGKISRKVNMAATASYRVIRCQATALSETKNAIRNLWKESYDDAPLRKVLIQINRLHKKLSSICTETNGLLKERLLDEWERTHNDWKDIRDRFEFNPIRDQIDIIIEVLGEIAVCDLTQKAEALYKCISDSNGDTCVVLPDDYDVTNTTGSLSLLKKTDVQCRFLRFTDYIALSNRGEVFDNVIVPWFDSSKYIKVKQSYCYKQLVYVLYDFENRWRSAYIKRIDDSFSHDELLNTVKSVRLSPSSVTSTPFDSVKIETTTDSPTKEDYDFDRTLLKRVVDNTSSSSELADSVECVPVILSEETVAYFGTGHEVIDVTDLCSGESDRYEKLPAEKLSQGRVILIRQSGKDLITEKADELMAIDKKSILREKAAVWSNALSEYADGKTIQEVTGALSAAGYACSAQQVRYWILGETIRPNDIEAIKSIASVCHNETIMKSVDEIYLAGGAVQEYHRKAGRWLSSELKNRAEDIATIYSSGRAAGFLDGIGDIHLYTVVEVLSKEFIPRGKINSMEVFA